MMTLGSSFSGVGGFELCGLLAGIEPRWLSEIEPFAVLVTHKRLPGVKQYGDARKLNGRELEPVDIITFGFPCFPKGTLVLTEEGYVPIEEITIGMKVLTHKGRWRKVTATGAKLGETVVLKGNHYGLECTPNHPIYSRGCLTEKKIWVPAGQMKGRLWAVPKTAESLPIPSISEDMLYAAGRWLCGCEETEPREIAEWLTDKYGKKLPGWVFGMSESCRASLLRGILDMSRNACEIETESKRLAESIRLLAEIQGYTTAVYQRDKYVITLTHSEHMSDELHGWYRVREIRRTNETKVVYNLTVDEDNSYVADGIVSHNCQDLSIAGKRAGLDGERSGLFHQAIRIICEMREATNGKYPRYAVAENVPGLFTSGGGEDFRAVLEELVRVKGGEVHVPRPEGKWAKAGEIVGDGFSVAWRVLDSQHWGVPQRRARVYIVGDFGGESAGKILFESESVCRNPSAGIRERERAAGDTEEVAGAAGGIAVENHPADSRVKISEKVQTLTSRMGTGGGNTPLVLAYGIGRPAFTSGYEANFSFAVNEELSPTLVHAGPNAVGKAYGICSKQSHAMLSGNPHTGFYEAKTSRTLDQGGGNPTCNQGGMCVCEPHVFDVRITSDGTKNTRAHCYETEISRCLDTSEPNPDSNHGSVCILEKPRAFDVRIGSAEAGTHYCETDKSRCLDVWRPNPNCNQGSLCILERREKEC